MPGPLLLTFTIPIPVHMPTVVRLLHLLFAICVAHALSAQIAYGGQAFGTMNKTFKLPPAAIIVLPAVDAEALIAADELRYANGQKGPYRFGYKHSTDLDLDYSGTWMERENGDRIWRLAIECPGALSINFRFDRYVVPHGGLVFVYNELGDQLGAFTAESVGGRNVMGVTQLPGERITVEYYEPAAVAGLGRLHIDEVVHGYRDIFKLEKGFGDSGDCNINVICPEGDDWRDQIRATAIITVGGDGFCTGTMLNSCALDGTPYFLTADHCLDSDVESWVFRFNWESPLCSPGQNAPADQTVSGCELLVNSAATDVALLRLNTAPPEEYEVFYSGWYKGPDAAQSVTGIHHPSGDIKKISRSFSPVVQGTFSGADCWQVGVWDEGTTEPGSSGSGLWDQNGLLVGQLFGGAADCDNSVDDYYGRLDVSWPLLEPFLGACGDTLLGGEGTDPVIPITNDAAVTSINNIPELLCGIDSITPQVTLKNNGNAVVTTITIQYGVAGLPPATDIWAGSLLPGETVNHTLPTISLPAGEYTFVVSSSAPNGLVDQVPTNDTWTQAIVVNAPAELVTLALSIDNFGSDVTWTLVTQLGTPLYAGGPYTNVNGGELIEIPFCLSNGCYTFTINDLFGDGICCTNGPGNYALLSADGTPLAESDGEYGAQDIRELCFANVSVPEQPAMGTLRLFPNPSGGQLELQVAGLTGPFQVQVLDGTGRIVHRTRSVASDNSLTMDLDHLVNGVYIVHLASAKGSLIQRLVIQR